ncbi:MAG: sugar ABC transporter permease [candidate division Zixibacteria bacterium]
MRTRNKILLFTTPWIVYLLVFWFYPICYSFYLSLTEYHLLTGASQFIGFDNYSKLFGDPVFITALKNTFIFVFGTIPVTTILALVLALFIAEKIPGHRIFQAAYFIPSITAMVVVALIFYNLYSRDGYIFTLCRMVGLSPPVNGFLQSESTALLSIMAMDIWVAIGYYVLIFLAGIKSIPVELYDAARVDGAGFIRRSLNVTIPLLKSTFAFVIVLNTIRSFQVFVEIFVMTSGRPFNSTLTAVYFIFDKGIARGDIGYASAAAYLLFMIILIFSLIQFRLTGVRRNS